MNFVLPTPGLAELNESDEDRRPDVVLIKQALVLPNNLAISSGRCINDGNVPIASQLNGHLKIGVQPLCWLMQWQQECPML